LLATKITQKLVKAEAKSSFKFSSEHDSGTEPVTPSDKQCITPEGNIIKIFPSAFLQSAFFLESK